MGSQNLELVRSLFADWERGDWSSVDWADPEIEFSAADGPSPFSVTGLAALAEAWREFLETWEGWRIEAEAFRELDDERVLVLVRIGGRGRVSGLEVDRMSATGANLFHLRDGKVTRLAIYWKRDRALADAGLTSEAGFEPA